MLFSKIQRFQGGRKREVRHHSHPPLFPVGLCNVSVFGALLGNPLSVLHTALGLTSGSAGQSTQLRWWTW